ncbi:MAG: DNA repair protein RecN [Lachnospiraceae bacterium]|nr:DNA repair protein RecN [Lachnospiraceae bacterium]
MLRNLHVKNLALIREIDVDLSDGLTVLTGETGAGKSIIIGSIQLALGGRTGREVRKDADEPSLVELVFESDNKALLALLEEWGIDSEDGVIVISRKIDGNRSVYRINGTTVTASQVRACTAGLIEIHGQHENQQLLNNTSQLALVDEFGGDAIASLRRKTAEAFRTCKALRRQLADSEMDEEERVRRLDFLSYEIEEIENADLKDNEDEELEHLYKKLSNARQLTSSVAEIYSRCGYEDAAGAGEQIGRALHELESIVRYDEALADMAETLTTIDGLLNDFNRDLSRYMSDLEEDPQLFAETEERLNTINKLKARFGQTLEAIKASYEERIRERDALMDYAARRLTLENELHQAEDHLQACADKLTKARLEAARIFEKEASGQLADLNFARADFEISFSKKETCTDNGQDDIEFMIATNPGEPLLPLRKVASGGELSRIMLAIRTIFADKDETGTLIFDEIDTGISGRTAQKAAEKLKVVGRSHQTICITHLPQIAAMADHHYAIVKDIADDHAATKITPLDEEASVDELARLLGGAIINDTTRQAAREMKAMSPDAMA